LLACPSRLSLLTSAQREEHGVAVVGENPHRAPAAEAPRAADAACGVPSGTPVRVPPPAQHAVRARVRIRSRRRDRTAGSRGSARTARLAGRMHLWALG